MLKIIIHLFIFAFLSVLTQVGGIVYFAALYGSNKFQLGRVKSVGLFVIVYLLTTFAIVPLIAPVFGRTALPITGNLRPLNIITCLLNRHYVRPELKKQLTSVAEQMNRNFDGTRTNYLDANFPFYEGFPLFPHLNHNDGRKVDLAFYYVDTRSGEQSNDAPSFIGYGIYEGPTKEEVNYPNRCAEQGFWQYGLLTYAVPKWNEDKLKVDAHRTAELIRLLAEDELTAKIFIEPHLKKRWNLSRYDKIRFHGCQAVRHDDHIHTQIKHQ